MFCILVLVLNESISRLIKYFNRTHVYWAVVTSLTWQHIAYQRQAVLAIIDINVHEWKGRGIITSIISTEQRSEMQPGIKSV